MSRTSKKVIGKRSGTEWEIDGKGVKVGDEGFVIIECRRYTTSKQKQEQVAGLAYRIIDTEADGAIIVSPLGLQEGAAKVAEAENIRTVHQNTIEVIRGTGPEAG
ncbi:restriction endonuclease [Streptomyces sp. A30]|uniref:restriction endonuclease n=1 Tax=Streptomyces sp. A30 TaxID=2789273 RepID=UPI00397FF10B